MHPFYVASQYHPEFKSRPERPAPLFREFVGAALEHAGDLSRRRVADASEPANGHRGVEASPQLTVTPVPRATSAERERLQRDVRRAVPDREPVRARARVR